MSSTYLSTDQSRRLLSESSPMARSLSRRRRNAFAVMALVFVSLWGSRAFGDVIIYPVIPRIDYWNQAWVSLTPLELLLVLGGLLAVFELIFFMGLVRTRKKFGGS